MTLLLHRGTEGLHRMIDQTHFAAAEDDSTTSAGLLGAGKTGAMVATDGRRLIVGGLRGCPDDDFESSYRPSFSSSCRLASGGTLRLSITDKLLFSEATGFLRPSSGDYQLPPASFPSQRYQATMRIKTCSMRSSGFRCWSRTGAGLPRHQRGGAL